MKIMTRNFTRTEKILLIVLAALFIGLLYYWIVHRNVTNYIASSNAEAQSLTSELDVAQAHLTQLNSMQDEVNDVMNSGEATRMESYNNSKAETSFLSEILSETKDYSISFADVTRNGDQIRRSFTLSYRTNNYRQAEAVMMRLCQSKLRCLMGDVNCSIDAQGGTSISMTATFFETMVGGVEDSLLPKDEAETTTPAEDFGIE